ncbi:MAG: serine hydrolase domain-containing protein [Candidatus Kapaibacteriota bacterium]
MFLIFMPSIVSAQQIPTFITDSLDSYIRRNMQAFRMPGLALCVVKDGKVIVMKTYGKQNFSEHKSISPRTIFPIASVTKTFTGTAMAMLETEKKLSLDDKLSQWLPYFAMKDTLYQRQITLTDILSHRSGWKTFQGDFLNTESSMTTRQMLEKFATLKPPYQFRTRFGYSNFGFLLAEEVFKPASGLTWQEFLQERIMNPLQMTRTFVQARDIEQDADVAVGHTLVNDSLVTVPKEKIEPRGYGGMFASIHDLGTWMNVLLNNGLHGGREVIPTKAIDRMWRSYTIIGKSKAADQRLYLKTYGLGWEIMQYRGQELLGHNGAYSGVLTKICMIPSERLGIAVLTNSDAHVFHELLSWQIVDAFLNVSAPDYAEEFFKRRNERKKNKAEGTIKLGGETKTVKNVPNNITLALSTMTGVYSCDSYGKAFITQTGNSIILRLEHHPTLQGVLTMPENHHLKCQYNHPMFGNVEFPLSIENGVVKGFTLFVDAFVEADGYEFRRVE